MGPPADGGGEATAVSDDDAAPDARAAFFGSGPILVAAAVTGSLLAFLEKLPCRNGGWNVAGRQFQLGCYTDIYPLYFTERLAEGRVPYTGHPVEYPVLIGAVMQAAAWLVRPITDPFARGQRFFDITAAGLALCLIAAVLATAHLAGPRRRRDALLVALSLALILSAFINWDLVAVVLVAVGMAAWAARRPAVAGSLFGLAVAA